jgi:hypothetical protein
LPADETQPPPNDSSEPLASPQKKKPQLQPQPEPKPATDQSANKTGFTAPKSAAISIPGLLLPMNPASPASLQFLLPLRPLSLRLPFRQRLEIEVFGRVVPDFERSNKAGE